MCEWKPEHYTDFEKLVRALGPVVNTTRTWQGRGRSPDELFRMGVAPQYEKEEIYDVFEIGEEERDSPLLRRSGEVRRRDHPPHPRDGPVRHAGDGIIWPLRASAQIDLLIDRADGVINLCEMKYAQGPCELTPAEGRKLRARREVFRSVTGTKKSVHLTLVTPEGVQDSPERHEIQSEVTLDDLFAF